MKEGLNMQLRSLRTEMSLNIHWMHSKHHRRIRFHSVWWKLPTYGSLDSNFHSDGSWKVRMHKNTREQAWLSESYATWTTAEYHLRFKAFQDTRSKTQNSARPSDEGNRSIPAQGGKCHSRITLNSPPPLGSDGRRHNIAPTPAPSATARLECVAAAPRPSVTQVVPRSHRDMSQT